MKRYYIYDNGRIHTDFSSIRSKYDIIVLQLYILNMFLIGAVKEKRDTSLGMPDVVIHIDKMSRVFCCEEEKIHSFEFPFNIKKPSEKYIVSHSTYNIDNKMLSILLSIFQEDLVGKSLEDILDLFFYTMNDYDVDDEQSSFCWNMIMFLLSYEPGYLRYDYDPDENRRDPIKHPLTHIDFYYESNNTFKLGLHDAINYDELVDLVDINRKCIYLEVYKKYT